MCVNSHICPVWQGDVGPVGPTGPQGVKGEQGDKGEKVSDEKYGAVIPYFTTLAVFLRCVFIFQGSPGFGIPGQRGPKGENGERVSLSACCHHAALNY